jgi:hypothetical protein
MVTGQQSARQAARRSALDAQAVQRKERADRQRRLEALAVAVLTALGERDGAVRDAEKRAAEALRTMTDEESLSSVTALGRYGEPDDIGPAIAALLGERTRLGHGQRIYASPT